MNNVVRNNILNVFKTNKKGTLDIILTEHSFTFNLEDVARVNVNSSLIIIKLKERPNDFYAIDSRYVQAYYYLEDVDKDEDKWYTTTLEDIEGYG